MANLQKISHDSDFPIQIKRLIQAKNRLQNSHPMAFKNNGLFLFYA